MRLGIISKEGLLDRIEEFDTVRLENAKSHVVGLCEYQTYNVDSNEFEVEELNNTELHDKIKKLISLKSEKVISFKKHELSVVMYFESTEKAECVFNSILDTGKTLTNKANIVEVVDYLKNDTVVDII